MKEKNEIKKYIVYFDLKKDCFIIENAKIWLNQWGLYEFYLGLVPRNHFFETKNDAMHYLKHAHKEIYIKEEA